MRTMIKALPVHTCISSGTVVLLKSYGMSQYLSQKRYSLTLFSILKMSFLDILFKIM